MFVKTADASYNGVYMVTEELLNFIRTQFASGTSPDEIEHLLVGEGGWDKDDVDEAMTSLGLIGGASSHSSSDMTESTLTKEVLPASVQDVAKEETRVLPVSEPVAVVSNNKEADDEDFLGIFNNEQSVAPIEFTPPKTVVPNAISLPTFELARALSSSPEQPKMIANVENIEIDHVQLDEAPSETGTLDQEVSLHIPKTEESPLSSLNPVDTMPGVQFDFSAISKNDDASPVQPLIIDTSDPALILGKTVETKSVTDAWLEGARDSKLNTDAAALATFGQVSNEKKPPMSRTMGSDILLRGVGATISGVPSLLPKEEKPATSSTEATSVAENIMRRNKIKKILLIAGGILVVLGVVIGGALFFMSTKSPDKTALFNNVFANFLSSTAFGYKGEGMMDIMLSTVTASGLEKGAMKFKVTYDGALKNGPSGYGDGNHLLKLAGGLQSGEFAWSTDIASDLKVIGDVLYFHVLSIPDSTNMDPNVLRTYWIEVNISDIAKELSLEGIAASQEGYGNFGGSTGDTSFNTLVKKSMPFTVGDMIKDTPSAKSVLHYKLVPDPDRMVELSSLLMRKYMNKDLILTDEKKIRLRDAFAKMTGEIWVDSETNTLQRIAISGDFDDEMFDSHVKGKVAFAFDFSDFNKAVTVDVPTPVLTLEELQARTEEYKKVKEKRASDQGKLDHLSLIKDALTLYYGENKKYPATLLQLVESGKLATSSVDTLTLKQYAYVSYVKDGVFTKAGRCTTKGKTCEYYHLGVNLDDVTNPALDGDADQSDEVVGKDTSGCAGEREVACYDIVSIPVVEDALPATNGSDQGTYPVIQDAPPTMKGSNQETPILPGVN